jgi:hypothetical protein
MAKVQYILIPEGWEEDYFKTIKVSDRFVYPRVVKTTRFISRKKKLQLGGISIFRTLKSPWKDFTDEEKAVWKAVAANLGLSSWQLFIHDTAARWKYGYPWYSDIVGTHQGNIGWLQIDSPADEIKITQLHPKFYWIEKKVTGFKTTYQPVKVTEDFALPLRIQLSYWSDLISVAEDSFAKFYAEVWHSYQGFDYKTELAINLDLKLPASYYGEEYFGLSQFGCESESSGWQTAEVTLTNVIGQLIHYDIFFHLKGLTGRVYFDNVIAEHSAQNWARDSRCNDIAKTFPRKWFLIPERWAGVTVPEKAFFESTFREF